MSRTRKGTSAGLRAGVIAPTGAVSLHPRLPRETPRAYKERLHVCHRSVITRARPPLCGRDPHRQPGRPDAAGPARSPSRRHSRCRDTRASQAGECPRHGTGARLTPVHDHNERDRAPWLAQLEAGRSVGLFSDAGTPLVSDPGFAVVRQVLEAGLVVVPVPGASALLCAGPGGTSTDDVRFCGFLPRQAGKREAAVQRLAEATSTLVFYEAQQRVLATLTSLGEVPTAQPRPAATSPAG